MLRCVCRVTSAALLASAVLLPHGAVAASGPPTVTVPVFASAPDLNGVPDASWKGAARISLAWDYPYRRPASQPTTVLVAQTAKALFLAYVVKQREPLTVTQQTNGDSVYNDDHVAVALYPQGAQGFMYIFRSNPDGARSQSSSENTAYAPQWQAAAKIVPGGYDVTMRIPFDVMRAGGSRTWRAQFTRYTVSDGAKAVWTHDPGQQYDIDVNYAGVLAGIDAKGGAVKPPARVQTYLLGAAGRNQSTSRAGLDFSVPITGTASFLGALHPDYSNVELDQQSIAPQEFPRFYQEVRPFFTQVSQQFNGHFGCWNCPTTLYTPAIPAFSQGYAVEGTQGPTNFAAFDAIGPERTDTAQVAGWLSSTAAHMAQVTFQRVTADTPQVHDVASTLATGYSFSHNDAYVYANVGTDRGNLVTDDAQGGYAEYGAGLKNQTSQIGLDYQRVGAEFQPYDGYVLHPDIAGWTLAGNKTFQYSPSSFVQQISASAAYDRFNDSAGKLDQSDQNAYVGVQTRSQLSLTLGTGSSYLLLGDGELAPFNQNSAELAFRANTSAPISVTYAQGRYYHGELRSWYRSATIPLRARLMLSLEADNSYYAPDPVYGAQSSYDEIAANQFLERATLDWQFSHDASLAVGARRITGLFAPTGFGYVPTAGTPGIDATNLSAAFHFLALRNEFYVVYGDPSRLSTTHALFFKWIRYIGAAKGT